MNVTRTHDEIVEMTGKAIALFVNVHQSRADGRKPFPMGGRFHQAAGDDIAQFQRQLALKKYGMAVDALSNALHESHKPHRDEMIAAFRDAAIPFNDRNWRNWLQGMPAEECHKWYFFEEWAEQLNA